jgi:hypothetical protein
MKQINHVLWQSFVKILKFVYKKLYINISIKKNHKLSI